MKTLVLIVTFLGSTLAAQAQWVEKVSGTTEELTDVHFLDETTGYIVGSTGTILKSIDGGETWNSLVSGTTENLEAVYLLIIKSGDKKAILRLVKQ